MLLLGIQWCFNEDGDRIGSVGWSMSSTFRSATQNNGCCGGDNEDGC